MEEVHLNDYKDIHEARSRIGYFSTQVYTLTPAFGVRVFASIEFQQKNLS